MPREDVAHILCDVRHVVAEELESGFEIPELQDKMERDRERACPDELLLGVAKFEVGMPVFVGKTWQRIQFIDFGAGQDRKAVRGGHEVFCS